MKKITFKVSNKNEGNVVSLIKKVNDISCRIQIDLENGFVLVENIDETMIDSVIELIDQHFTISSINIDNTSDESISVNNIQNENVYDTIFKKIKSENKYIEASINKFIKTIYWARYKRNIPDKKIGARILSYVSEISMRYNNKVCIEYSVGDIVDCNYGIHLNGEINGEHIQAIVCSIALNNTAYLVPITQFKEHLDSLSYITFDVPKDVIYEDAFYVGGTVLLDKGGSLNTAKFNKVVGKTTPEFFAKILNQLSTTYDFTNHAIMNISNEIDSDSNNDVEETTTKKIVKIGINESALLDVIGESLDKLDPTKKVEEQVTSFLIEIGMVSTEKIVTQSFVIACNIKKINYENVILELHKIFPNEKENDIKLILKESFKEWLNIYPEIKEKSPKSSIISLLKIFARQFS